MSLPAVCDARDYQSADDQREFAVIHVADAECSVSATAGFMYSLATYP